MDPNAVHIIFCIEFYIRVLSTVKKKSYPSKPVWHRPHVGAGAVDVDDERGEYDRQNDDHHVKAIVHT